MAHRADHPVHIAQDSLLSSSSGYTNYGGYLNLAILMLVLACSRVALENIIKYGILIEPFQWMNVFMHDPYQVCASWHCFSNLHSSTSKILQVPNVVLCLVLNVFIFSALFIEKQLGLFHADFLVLRKKFQPPKIFPIVLACSVTPFYCSSNCVSPST
jgi:diacylglycerol O-acyltransferase-1